jgi:Fe-S-cluster containining protein
MCSFCCKKSFLLINVCIQGNILCSPCSIVGNVRRSVEGFRYLGTTLTNQNSIQEEIKSRLKSGNACYHSVQNLLSSSLLSEILKIKIYRTIIFLVVFDMDMSYARMVRTASLTSYPVRCKILHQRPHSHKWRHAAAGMRAHNVLCNSYNTRPLLCARKTCYVTVITV